MSDYANEFCAAWNEVWESFQTLQRASLTLSSNKRFDHAEAAKALFADLVQLIGVADPTWRLRVFAQNYPHRPEDHAEHGRGTAEDGPDAPDCPCRATDLETECAGAGCGFCRSETITIVTCTVGEHDEERTYNLEWHVDPLRAKQRANELDAEARALASAFAGWLAANPHPSTTSTDGATYEQQADAWHVAMNNETERIIATASKTMRAVVARQFNRHGMDLPSFELETLTKGKS